MDNRLGLMVLILATAFVCGCGRTNATQSDVKVGSVDESLFIKESLVKEITREDCRLGDGTETQCFKVVVKADPKEHKMGPWCPEKVTDSKEKGGIWFKDGKVYDVDGKFITNLDEFYSDPKWKLYREDGSINVTKSQEACEAAARPDVDEKYNNYCVECAPSFYKSFEITYLIPVKPVYKEYSVPIRRDGIGVAFNGVGFDPPAPVHAILDAHTLAPLDDCGGHVNPHKGYHYHAAQGCSKEDEQKDTHAPMIGYALDGFGIYSLLDSNKKEPTGLDECRGHIDETRGYHYHAGRSGDNQIISCFQGAPGYVQVAEIK